MQDHNSLLTKRLIVYSLTMQDYLTLRLFSNSQSEKIRKIRTLNRHLLPLVYLVIGAGFYFWAGWPFLVILMSFSALWYGCYPLIYKFKYKKLYEKLEKDNRKAGKVISLSLHEDYLFIEDDTSETKLKYLELKQLSELPDNYFLSLHSGGYIIFTKTGMMEGDLHGFLDDLTERTGIPREDRRDWKWK